MAADRGLRLLVAFHATVAGARAAEEGCALHESLALLLLRFAQARAQDTTGARKPPPKGAKAKRNLKQLEMLNVAKAVTVLDDAHFPHLLARDFEPTQQVKALVHLVQMMQSAKATPATCSSREAGWWRVTVMEFVSSHLNHEGFLQALLRMPREQQTQTEAQYLLLFQALLGLLRLQREHSRDHALAPGSHAANVAEAVVGHAHTALDSMNQL